MPKISSLESHLRRILSLIYNHELISRTGLVEHTGYSTFLISKLTERLLKDQIIQEVGTGQSSGGRPPTLLSINPDIGRLVGLHMGTINLRAVVTDLRGTVLARKVEKSLVDQGPDEALNHTRDVIFGLLKQAQVKRGELLGIGMGIASVLDRNRGVSLYWPKVPSWMNVPIKELLKESFHTLVEVDDVPRTMALAEKRFGKARGVNDFVYLSFGAGTGSAMFFGGKLYAGKGGFAGEFGHTTIDERGPLCSCGNRGCVEALVSASTVIHRAEEALSAGLSNQLYMIARENGGRLTLESIAQAAEANDRFCLSLFSEIGLHAGIGIAGLINLLNPELIVLGGGLTKAAGKWLLPAIERVVQERAMQNAAGQATITLSDLSEIDWARGAALLVNERAIHRLLSEAGSQSKGFSNVRSRQPAGTT